MLHAEFNINFKMAKGEIQKYKAKVKSNDWKDEICLILMKNAFIILLAYGIFSEDPEITLN